MSEKTVALTQAGDEPATAVSLWRIFGAFFWLGCTSFGGGSAGWLHREMVMKRRWIDDQTFLATMALGQVMPGANGVKLSVLIGRHLRGGPGAALALFGLLSGPFAIMLTVGAVYAGFGQRPVLHAMLDGIAAVVVGLTFATGLGSVWRGFAGPAASDNHRRHRAVRRRTALAAGSGRPGAGAAQHRPRLRAAAALRCATATAIPLSRYSRCSRRCRCCPSAAATPSSPISRSNRSRCMAGPASASSPICSRCRVPPRGPVRRWWR